MDRGLALLQMVLGMKLDHFVPLQQVVLSNNVERSNNQEPSGEEEVRKLSLFVQLSR